MGKLEAYLRLYRCNHVVPEVLYHAHELSIETRTASAALLLDNIHFTVLVNRQYSGFGRQEITDCTAQSGLVDASSRLGRARPPPLTLTFLPQAAELLENAWARCALIAPRTEV